MANNWKDIDGYDGVYKINEQGEVISYARPNTIIRKASCNSDGYLYISLSKNDICKGKCIHRLVAETFIPNPNNLPEVNHKDGNKLNNSIENLEWCSHSENMSHASKTGLMKGLKGLKNPKAKLNHALISEIIEKYPSKTSYEIAREYGIDPSTVQRIFNGTRWSDYTGIKKKTA